MSSSNDDAAQTYKVLVNFEEQYSFWPTLKKELPAGWRDTGIEGTKEFCAVYVEKNWTDMRPLSLRKQMEAETACD